ncbi:unnamed protein product [Closterium sp. NIES-53]
MASLRVLALDHEGRPIQFDTWLDDLQLYLLSDSRDSVLLFDHTSGAAHAPPTTVDSATRSQWLTRDAAARLAIRNHLPLAECAHFGQHRTAQALYDAVVARYSLPSTTALGCLLLPYLFPELFVFATVKDLVSHLCTNDARYRAALPADFLAKNPPSMYITLYFIVTRLLDSLRAVRDHFFALDPTALTVDLLEQHLVAAETSVVALGAARGTPCTPFFEGCSPSPLAPSYAYAAAANVPGASESVLPGTGTAEASHTFTLDSRASRCFFRDNTTLTPLTAPVPVRLADPSGSPDLAHSSTVLPCPAVPSASLSGLHLPSFSTNLVSTAALQDAMVHTTTPRGVRVRSGSTPLLVSPPVAQDPSVAPPPGSPLLATPSWHALPPPCLWSSQVSASPPALACPALPSLRRGAAARCSSLLLVSPDDCSPATFHMDVWGPARVSGQGRERYFLLIDDDYTRYTTVFPCAARVRGGEFSSDLLREFCCGEGILLSFTLLDSPQQNGIAERRIGLVMEVAHPSMIHAAAPHFMWPFAVRYAAHQLNLLPRVSLPETLPTLRWTGKVGDASVFRVWGSRAFVRDTSADKLSAHAISCVFLGFSPDTPGWQFYHPTSRHVFSSQDVTFDEYVPFYHLFPYRSAPPPPPLLFLALGPPPIDPLPPQGPAPSGVSQVDPLPGPAPVEEVVGSGAARGVASGGAASGGAEPGGAESEGGGFGGAEPGGAEIWGAEPKGVEPGGAEPEGVEPGGAKSEGAESGGAEPRGTASSRVPAGASPLLSPRREPLSPQQLREWFAQRTRLRSGAAEVRVSAAGDTGAGGAGVTAGAGGPGGAAAAGPGGSCTRGTGAARIGGVGGAGARDPTEPGGAGVRSTRVGGTGAGGAGAVDPGAGGAGGTMRPLLYFVSLLQRVLACVSSCLPVRTGPRVPRPHPPPVPGTHTMALRPSSVPLRVPLPPSLESSLHAVPDPDSDRARAASPTISPVLAIVVTDPFFESTAASALVAKLVDFAASCRLDYATALVVESESAGPPSVGGECALGTDVLEDRQEDFECLADAVPSLVAMLLALVGDPDAPDIPTPRSYAEAITGPYSSKWQTAMDAEMES